MQQARAACNQNLAWRAVKAAVTRAPNIEIGNNRTLWTVLIREAYRIMSYVLGYNTVAGRPGWSSFHVTLLIFSQVCK